MPSKKPTAKVAGGAADLPKWQRKIFMSVVDSADNSGILIASRRQVANRSQQQEKFGLALDK